jgi:hypothetical protein
MVESDSFYARAERRIEWMTVVVGLVGATFAVVRWGWRQGAGVALGGGLMWLNFRWLKQGVGVLVTVSTAQQGLSRARVPWGVFVKFFGRFALLLVVVYVILSRSLLPAEAVVAGLFALVAAVMLELLFELFRGKGRTETRS